jgi:preprotein translocase subunit YajC
LTEKGCYDIFCWIKASGNNEKNKILNYERKEVMVNLLFAYGQQGGTTGQGTGSGSPMSLIFMIIAIFAVMYFLMIRPQQRQKKQHQELLSKVSKGDKIVTSGGMYGTIVGVKDSTVIVKIADNVKVEVNRSAISQIVSSRSSKSQTARQDESDQKEDKAKK